MMENGIGGMWGMGLWGLVGLVVGLPVHMSGDEGGKAREAREFGYWIAAETNLPVTYWDERYTSLRA